MLRFFRRGEPFACVAELSLNDRAKCRPITLGSGPLGRAGVAQVCTFAEMGN